MMRGSTHSLRMSERLRAPAVSSSAAHPFTFRVVMHRQHRRLVWPSGRLFQLAQRNGVLLPRPLGRYLAARMLRGHHRRYVFGIRY